MLVILVVNLCFRRLLSKILSPEIVIPMLFSSFKLFRSVGDLLARATVIKMLIVVLLELPVSGVSVVRVSLVMGSSTERVAVLVSANLLFYI